MLWIFQRPTHLILWTRQRTRRNVVAQDQQFARTADELLLVVNSLESLGAWIFNRPIQQKVFTHLVLNTFVADNRMDHASMSTLGQAFDRLVVVKILLTVGSRNSSTLLCAHLSVGWQIILDQ